MEIFQIVRSETLRTAGDIAELWDISHTNTKAAAGARAVLSVVLDTVFRELIQDIENPPAPRLASAPDKTKPKTNEKVNEQDMFESIKIYPNPASSELFVEVEGTDEINWEITLYSIVGHHVLTTRIEAGNQKKTIDITNVPIGVYFYRAENTLKQNTNGRIVIIR